MEINRRRHKLKEKDLALGTWNIRSLCKTGSLKNLLDQMMAYKLGILSLQETNWNGTDIWETRNHIIFSSGKLDKMRNVGVAFIVDKAMRSSIIQFTPINERICTLRMRTRFFNLSIVNCHSPTEEKDENIKDEFYDKLGRIFDSLPSNDIKIIMGDLNAKIGKEEIYQGTIGTHSLHLRSNNNGQRLIDFAISKNMVISSTLFPHRNIHKYTWASPDGRTFNQIDHLLIERRGANSILDVRSYRGAECDTDHFLVKARFRSKIASQKIVKKTAEPKFHLDLLEELDTREKYKLTLMGCMNVVEMEEEGNNNKSQNDNDIEHSWELLKAGILEAATKTVGQQPKLDKSEWFDEDCDSAIKAKNIAYKNYISRPSRLRKQAYELARREAHRICRNKKRTYVNNKLQKMEKDFNESRSHSAFKMIKNIKRGFVGRTVLCKDDDGNIIGDDDKIRRRWKQYFEGLLNSHPSDLEEIPQYMEDDDVIIEPPTRDDVEHAIQALRNKKAAGVDRIPAELIKYGGQLILAHIHKLILEIWRQEQIPEDWKKTIIVPIHKKGDRLDCHNYKGISLLCTTYKIFTALILEKLQPFVEPILGEYQ